MFVEWIMIVFVISAQGKALNRNKQSTSIFDRLDKTPSGKVQPSIPLTKVSFTFRLPVHELFNQDWVIADEGFAICEGLPRGSSLLC